jgi:hypothetical protein
MFQALEDLDMSPHIRDGDNPSRDLGRRLLTSLIVVNHRLTSACQEPPAHKTLPISCLYFNCYSFTGSSLSLSSRFLLAGLLDISVGFPESILCLNPLVEHLPPCHATVVGCWSSIHSSAHLRCWNVVLRGIFVKLLKRWHANNALMKDTSCDSRFNVICVLHKQIYGQLLF